MEADGVDGSDADAAGHFFVERAHLVFEGIVGRQNLPAALEEDLPLGRGSEGPL